MAKLAVLFPGIGYTCDKPLLYYGSKLAEQAGYEIKKVAYALPEKVQFKGNPEKMEEGFRSLYVQAEECLKDVDWAQYEEVLFVSKSIGTVIAAAYAGRLAIPNLRHVLYTPLEYTFGYHPQQAIGFSGTDDSWCDFAEVHRLAREQGIFVNVYAGANHSLETGNVPKDLATLQDVMDKTRTFILR